jgi:ABC-type multidrug transport system permease subunit
VKRDLSEKGWVPLRYWVAWWGFLALAMVVFYVLLTPIWIGIRVAGWLAARRG